MIKVITNRAPAFLKAAYSCPDVDLQNHTEFISPLEKYIEWDGTLWRVHQMTAERVPRFCGKYRDIRTAIVHAR